MDENSFIEHTGAWISKEIPVKELEKLVFENGWLGSQEPWRWRTGPKNNLTKSR